MPYGTLLRFPYLVLRICDGVFSNELQFRQLQKFLCIWYTIEHFAQVFQCFVMTDAHQCSKCVSFAGGVVFLLQEVEYKIWRIGNELFEMLVYRGYRKYSILANVDVTMFEALSCGLE
jgi:hypothetical protein